MRGARRAEGAVSAPVIVRNLRTGTRAEAVWCCQRYDVEPHFYVLSAGHWIVASWVHWRPVSWPAYALRRRSGWRP